MPEKMCAYCVNAKSTSTTPPGKIWCDSLKRTMDRKEGKNCPYYR